MHHPQPDTKNMLSLILEIGFRYVFLTREKSVISIWINHHRNNLFRRNMLSCPGPPKAKAHGL